MAAAAVVVAVATYGQLDELTSMCQLVEHICANAGQASDDTAAGPGTCIGLHHAGDLDAAVKRLPTTPVPMQMIARYWAATQARLAVARHDADLVRVAVGMHTRDPSEVHPHFLHVVDWGLAVIEDDLGRAVVANANAIERVHGFSRIELLVERAATLLALDDAPAAGAVVGRLERLLSALTEPAPLPRAHAHLLHARLALRHGDIAAAEAAAHEAMRLADSAGLRLVRIDALEAVGAVLDSIQAPVRAARLLGAASEERDRTGYRGRIFSGAPHGVVTRLATSEPQAWNEGKALTLDQAVALAQRSRGPRGRPSFGFPALTPTEQLVVQHVVAGSTNSEIAAAMLITVPTIKTHLKRIFAKLGVRNRSELAALAARRQAG